MRLRFHWMLPKAGEVGIESAEATAHFRTECYKRTSPAGRPDMAGWSRFVQCAEQAGIESVLMSCGPYEPDTLLVACALGQAAKQMKFMVAYRSGWMQPTTFVQQINTISGLIGGRVSVNLVAGSSTEEQRAYGDYLDHDDRYARADEFMGACRSFWEQKGNVNFNGEYYRVEKGRIATPFQAPDRCGPEIYVSGHSERARALAYSQGDCWLRVVDTPEKLQPIVAEARKAGIDVGLRLGLVCRSTREEAVRAAQALLPLGSKGKRQAPIVSKDDSQMYREATQVAEDATWLNRNIWQGLVPYYGPVWTTLVGTPDDLVEAFLEYKEIGVRQFIISGCPEVEAVAAFGRDILPKIRAGEECGVER